MRWTYPTDRSNNSPGAGAETHHMKASLILYALLNVYGRLPLKPRLCVLMIILQSLCMTVVTIKWKGVRKLSSYFDRVWTSFMVIS